MKEKTQRYGSSLAARSGRTSPLPAGWKAVIWLASALAGWALVALLGILIL